MNKFYLMASVVCLVTASESYAETEKEVAVCPEITTNELKALNGGHVLTVGAHRWYLHDMFELPETLGSHVPLDLTVKEVMETREVKYFGQLDPHTCQYKIVLEKDRKANLTFKLMGE